MSDVPAPESRRRRLVAAVGAVAALALLARLAWLGGRTVHWDEARTGYWALRYAETGWLQYRPVAGGPFLYLVDGALFPLVGATDFAARLPVALIGGALPLVALLLRNRLSATGVVILAVALAADPLLLYYSRFLRGDVPLAAFALLTVGLVARLFDTGRRRYLYGAAAAFALALATSGFAVAVVAVWAAAAFLAFDHRRLLGDGDGARDRLLSLGRTAVERSTPLARAFLLWFGVVLFFYAPRTPAGPGLRRPSTWPVVLEAATVEAAKRFFAVRVASRAREAAHPLVPFVRANAELLLAVSLPVVALAAFGFLRERYGRRPPRPIVAFCAYWGGLGLLVFPVVTELNAPWVAVHVVAPLAVPAAAGGAALLDAGRRAAAREDAATVAAVALLCLAGVGQAGAVAASGAYGSPAPDDPLVQYGQPADDLDPLVDRVAAVADDDGADVLFYGSRFYLSSESAADRPPVPDRWGNRLPLPWYFQRAGVETESANDLSALQGSVPPVVVADPERRGELEELLEGYEAEEYRLALWNRRVVVFVRE